MEKPEARCTPVKPPLVTMVHCEDDQAPEAPSELVTLGAAPLSIHIVGLILFAGRLLHAFALSNSGGTSMARAIGIVLTWVAYVFAAVALLFNAIA